MPMGVLALSVANMWMAAFEIPLGVMALVFGLRRRGQLGESQAPIGAMFLVSAALKLLGDVVPHQVLLPLVGMLFVACSVWFVRTFRAGAARRRELRERRSAAASP